MGKPGYVYVMVASGVCSNHYKIGFSDNPKRRLQQIATMPFPITLLHTVACEDMAGTEEKLHSFFATHRVRGEWFVLSNDQVSKLVACGTEVELINMLSLVPQDESIADIKPSPSKPFRWLPPVHRYNKTKDYWKRCNPTSSGR